jgi:hypothetical protein
LQAWKDLPKWSWDQCYDLKTVRLKNMRKRDTYDSNYN